MANFYIILSITQKIKKYNTALKSPNLQGIILRVFYVFVLVMIIFTRLFISHKGYCRRGRQGKRPKIFNYVYILWKVIVLILVLNCMIFFMSCFRLTQNIKEIKHSTQHLKLALYFWWNYFQSCFGFDLCVFILPMIVYIAQKEEPKKTEVVVRLLISFISSEGLC